MPALCIKADDNGHVAVILNRPDRANALRPADMHELAANIDMFGQNGRTMAITVTGAGMRHFCAGLDLSQPDLITGDLAGDGPTGLGAVLRAAKRCRVPLIGRINGACIGGGMGILAACDIAIAVDTAQFALPEIRSGIAPLIVTAAMAGHLAAPILFDLALGDEMSATRAVQLGLVVEAVPAAVLDVAVQRRIESLRLLTPSARFALLRQTRDMRLSDSLEDRVSSAEAAARRLATGVAVAPDYPFSQ